MKKNKKRLLISIAILFITWCGVLVYVIMGKNNDIEKKDTYGIESITTLNNIGIKLGEDFYVKHESDKLVVYDFNNDVISEYADDFTGYEIFDKRLIIINDDEMSVIINKNGTTLKSGEVIIGSQDNKYILVDDTIYDYNLREIYKLDVKVNKEYNALFVNDLFIYDISDNITENVIVDLEEENVLLKGFSKSYSFYYYDVIYFAVTLNDISYLLDVNTKKIVYEDIKVDEDNLYYNIFTYKDNTYYISDKIYGENTKISDKYIMTKDTCEDGYKLKDLNGKTIIDQCMNGYKILFDDAIVGLSVNGHSILFYKDKKIEGAVFSLQGDYIKVEKSVDLLGYGSESTYYNKDLEKIDFDGNASLYYIGNGYYYSYDINDNSYYFYDKDLNKVSDKLSSIICNKNTYCDVTTNNYTHYLYKDGKKVFEEKLTNIKLDDNEILIETLYKTYLLKLGNNKNVKLDLSFDYNIDVDKIISKYDLKKDESIIKQNKELFIQYAYLVENSNNLMDYKKQVFDLFKVIIDNSKYLDEFYFLYKLGKLNIIYEEATYNGNAISTYADSVTKVSLSSSQDSIIYHELMHFVDFSINYNSNNWLYKCDGKYKIMPASENIYDGCDSVIIHSTNYLTEAGAEIFKAKYFTKEIKSIAYYFASNYLEGLEYIFGSEEINKWYFGDVNNFYIALLNDYENVDIVNKIIDALNSTTSLEEGSNSNVGYLLDILIDLYKKHIGNDYLSDKKFSFILKSMSDNDYINTSKYYNEFKSVLDMDYGSLNELKEKTEYDMYGNSIDPVIIDNKMYLSWNVSNKLVAKCAVIWINYDFDNDKVTDYIVIEENIKS